MQHLWSMPWKCLESHLPHRCHRCRAHVLHRLIQVLSQLIEPLPAAPGQWQHIEECIHLAAGHLLNFLNAVHCKGCFQSLKNQCEIFGKCLESIYIRPRLEFFFVRHRDRWLWQTERTAYLLQAWKESVCGLLQQVVSLIGRCCCCFCSWFCTCSFVLVLYVFVFWFRFNHTPQSLS